MLHVLKGSQKPERATLSKIKYEKFRPKKNLNELLISGPF